VEVTKDKRLTEYHLIKVAGGGEDHPDTWASQKTLDTLCVAICISN
jgi:hypothetical protein